ncbi:long-chain fatty acid--CoA ligase [Candidatus Bathyarchaeota archaeon]|nr:long-chain fatty acid--CoA ligase [Candidatus Bathyarchaeota archaeon]
MSAKRKKKVEKKPEEKPWYKFYPPGVRRHIVYPEIPLHELLRNAAQKYADKTAIIYFDRKISYKELNMLTDKFAASLANLGIKKGDKVAILLPNIPQFVISYYGTLKAGAVVTTINPLYKEREVEHQLNDSEAETIVVLDLVYPIVEKIWEKTKLGNVIVTSIKDYMPPFKAALGSLLGKVPTRKVRQKTNLYFFTELIAKYEATPPKVEINPKDDLAALQYTGGTTGISKGAMLTHMNLVSNALMCKEWLQASEGEEVVLAALPLFHIYGMTTSMNAPISFAGAMVLLPRFDPANALQAIQKYRVTVFCGVPTMYAMLLTHPKLKKYNLNSIKFCVSGAAPLPPEIQKKFIEVTGGVLVEGYGLTEASPITHVNPFDKSMRTVKIGSIGIPWPDTDAKIVDMETGERELPPGEVGELVVKGPQVMKGYWKMPEETSAVLRNGWLYTGDIGKMDEEGYFYITDRKKDLIKFKGYSVYPRELEDVLYEHPAVKLCCVVGKPDPVAGEVPKAFVVLKEGVTATEEELMRFVNERVAPYKAIRELELRTELPLSAVGKVLRRVLREEEIRKAAAKT